MTKYLNHWLLGFILVFTLLSCEDSVESRSYGSISGQVLSKVSLKPLEGAVITTNPPSRSVLSDSEGRFIIEDLVEGDYIVTAERNEYANKAITVNVRKDKVTEFTIQMEDGDLAANTVKFHDPFPGTNQGGVGIPTTISWDFIGVTDSTDLTFNLKVFTNESEEPIIDVADIVDTFYVADNLSYSKNHFWTVTAKKNEDKIGQSDLWNFKTISSASLPFMFVEVGDANIYLSAEKEGSRHRMTHETILNSFPRSNPITDEVIYSASYNSQIYIFLTYGEEQITKRISPLPVDGNHQVGAGFCWSPNGEEVLFCHYDKLYKINKDGSGLFTVSTADAGRNYVFVDWSELANKIVVQTRGVNIYDSEIHLMDPDGTNSSPIVNNADGRTEYPTFSIDGKSVIYTHDFSDVNSHDGRMLDSRIFLYDIASATVSDLSGSGKANGTNDLQPRFSPDGSKIIFVNTSNTGTGQKDIYVMDAAGGNRELYFENAEMPEWR